MTEVETITEAKFRRAIFLRMLPICCVYPRDHFTFGCQYLTDDNRLTCQRMSNFDWKIAKAQLAQCRVNIAIASYTAIRKCLQSAHIGLCQHLQTRAAGDREADSFARHIVWFSHRFCPIQGR